MVIVVQLVRTPDCGSGGRGFESRLSPSQKAHLRNSEMSFFLSFHYNEFLLPKNLLKLKHDLGRF